MLELFSKGIGKYDDSAPSKIHSLFCGLEHPVFICALAGPEVRNAGDCARLKDLLRA